MLNQEPAQPVDSEIFRSGSLDEDKRPIELFEHAHEASRGPEDALSPTDEEVKRPKIGSKTMLLGILINTSATIGIVSIAGPEKVTVRLSGIIEVFTNKPIFDDLEFGRMQLSFAAYHFALTALLLWALATKTVLLRAQVGTDKDSSSCHSFWVSGRLAELFIRQFLHWLLPDGASPRDAVSGSDQFSHLREQYATHSGVHANSHLSRDWDPVLS